MASDLEQRAREMLDTALRDLGLHEDAYHVGCGAELDQYDRAAINAIAAALLAAQQPAAPVLAKHQPCGCVICTCEDEQQCQGCGAKHCGNRADHPPYVGQQPAAPSGEAVAWVAADTLNSPHPTCISSLAYMSQLDRERGREYVPLYAAPVAAQKADDALDAARYRWLRDQTETDGIAIVMKNKHFDESSTCAENIDKFIDAAIAATDAQPQGEEVR